jgi:hypothetical protein
MCTYINIVNIYARKSMIPISTNKYICNVLVAVSTDISGKYTRTRLDIVCRLTNKHFYFSRKPLDLPFSIDIVEVGLPNLSERDLCRDYHGNIFAHISSPVNVIFSPPAPSIIYLASQKKNKDTCIHPVALRTIRRVTQIIHQMGWIATPTDSLIKLRFN